MNSKLTPALQNALLGRINHMLGKEAVENWHDLCSLCSYYINTAYLRPHGVIILENTAAACMIQRIIVQHDLSDPLPFQRVLDRQDRNRLHTFGEIGTDLKSFARAIEDYECGFVSEAQLLKVIGTTPRQWQRKAIDKPNQDYGQPRSFEYLKALA